MCVYMYMSAPIRRHIAGNMARPACNVPHMLTDSLVDFSPEI